MSRGWPMVLVALGCRPTAILQEGYGPFLADGVCERTRECARGAFDSLYFGMEDCRDSWERALNRTVTELADSDCDYDAARAAEVYNELLDMSCEDFVEGKYQEAALDVWDCPIRN
ncbi:MAG: hypothetical protein ABMA64_12835 [Myxococcota bacterium]